MRRRILGAVVAVTVGLAALTGCSGPAIDDAVKGLVDKGLDQVGGGIDSLVSEALGGAELTTDGTLPDSFPDTVPLVDGTVLGGGAGPAGAGWVARVSVPSADAFEQARQALEEAGFTGTGIETDAQGAAGNFTSADHNVVLTVASDAGDIVATYVVTPR